MYFPSSLFGVSSASTLFVPQELGCAHVGASRDKQIIVSVSLRIMIRVIIERVGAQLAAHQNDEATSAVGSLLKNG